MLEKTIDLFNFSKIKSECIYHMADYNMFKYDFSNNEQISSKNTYINSPMKDTRRHYIKKVIVNIPSNDKLKEDNFKNDFLYLTFTKDEIADLLGKTLVFYKVNND